MEPKCYICFKPNDHWHPVLGFNHEACVNKPIVNHDERDENGYPIDNPNIVNQKVGKK